MRKLFVCAFALVMALASCSDKSEDATPAVKKGTPIETKFAVSGVKFSEGTQMKATAEPDLIALQVTEIQEDNTKQLIASGLFRGDDLLDQLSVVMKHGFQYEIEGTVVRHGGNVETFTNPETNAVSYGRPFHATEAQTVESNVLTVDNNDFNQNPKTFINLAAQCDGSAIFQPARGLVAGERWYFKKTITAQYKRSTSDYDDGKIKIDFKRVCFKLMYNVYDLKEGNKFKANPFVSTQTSGLTWKELGPTSHIVYTCADIAATYEALATEQEYSLDLGIFTPTNNTTHADRYEKASISVKPNFQYAVNWSGSLDAENSFSITIQDVWESDETPR